MPTISGKHGLRVVLFSRAAGDAIGGLGGAFAGFLICKVAFNDKGLSNVRKV